MQQITPASVSTSKNKLTFSNQLYSTSAHGNTFTPHPYQIENISNHESMNEDALKHLQSASISHAIKHATLIYMVASHAGQGRNSNKDDMANSLPLGE